jgi:plastocyanin
VVTALVVAAAGLAPTACSAKPPRTHTVTIANFVFQPATITVAPGDTVVWRNTDIVPHSATARDSTWDSQSLAANATWSYVATQRGQYAYYCVFHPNMTGTIDVQ